VPPSSRRPPTVPARLFLLIRVRVLIC
jgi:hypothetical protein